VKTLVLPKVHSAADLTAIAKHIPDYRKVNIIASIESARSLWAIGDIASWSSQNMEVVALLVRDVSVAFFIMSI
jgi:citrate lyase subunit beta-like protein